MSAAAATDLAITRSALHALAEQVISPVRQRATGGRIALEARPGGFGTHVLPDGGWVGVSGEEIVIVEPGGARRSTPITTVRAAAAFVGDPDSESLPDEPLTVSSGAASVIAAAFDGGAQALGALIATAAPGDDPSGIDLWPEHFDIAITMGSERAGTRATYGVSPGDEHHPAPYAYVAPWSTPPTADGWNATGFTGAELAFSGTAATLAFFQDRRAALAR